jgi:histidinol-phosphate aminotransferase
LCLRYFLLGRTVVYTQIYECLIIRILPHLKTSKDIYMERRDWLKMSGLALSGISTKQQFNFLDAIRPSADGLIHLDKNENPFGVSPLALKAMQNAMSEGHRYLLPELTASLRQKLATREKLEASNVLLAAGSVEVLGITSLYVSRKGGSVVCPYPTFATLPNYCKNMGMELINVPVTANEKLVDLEAMKAKIKDDTRLVYLCNPNNPTGTTLNAKVLRDFVEEVSQKTMVMVDEAYFEFLNESVSDMVRSNRNVLVSRTFSKVYGFAGLRVGYLIGHADTLKEMAKYQAASTLGISRIAIEAGLAALDDTQFLSMYLQKNQEALDYTYKALTGMGVAAVASKANFMMFPIDTYKGSLAKDMATKKILVRDDYKELNGNRWGRVSIGTMDEMRAFIKELRNVI